jgi:hypothetical protein
MHCAWRASRFDIESCEESIELLKRLFFDLLDECAADQNETHQRKQTKLKHRGTPNSFRAGGYDQRRERASYPNRYPVPSWYDFLKVKMNGHDVARFTS